MKKNLCMVILSCLFLSCHALRSNMQIDVILNVEITYNLDSYDEFLNFLSQKKSELCSESRKAFDTLEAILRKKSRVSATQLIREFKPHVPHKDKLRAYVKTQKEQSVIIGKNVRILENIFSMTLLNMGIRLPGIARELNALMGK